MDKKARKRDPSEYDYQPQTNMKANVGAFLTDVFHYGKTYAARPGNGVVPEVTKHLSRSWAVYDDLAPYLLDLKEGYALPDTVEKASEVIVEKSHTFEITSEIKAFLGCYEFPLPTQTTFNVSCNTVTPTDASRPKLYTYAVEENDVTDGNSFIAWAEMKDYHLAPTEVQELMEYFYKLKKGDANRQKYIPAVVAKLNEYGYSALPTKQGLAQRYKIRLRGTHAPYLKQNYGQTAKAELSSLISGRRLTVVVHELDNSLECISDVYVDDVFVQETLLKNGAAWYSEDEHREFLHTYFKKAQDENVGLWKEKKPTPPWLWIVTHPQN